MFRIVLALVAVLALFEANGAAMAQNDAASQQQHGPIQRLYLRDGSFQVVTEYHLQGDHVHYFSAERAAWEDVPMEQVDLAATQKWNANRGQEAATKQAARQAEREAVDKEIRAQLDATRPEVAAGLRLPEKGALWGLDDFQGKPELIPIVQPAAEAAARERARSEFAALNKKERKDATKIAQNEATAKAYEANAAAQPPLPADAKRVGGSEELHLAHVESKRQFHIAAPVIFVRSNSLAGDKFVLERMEQDFKRQERRMAPPSADAAVGGSGKGYAAVHVEKLGSDWWKLSFPAELPIGEYALVHLLGDGQWDAHVWDFGVNPRAFENGEAVTVEQPLP